MSKRNRQLVAISLIACLVPFVILSNYLGHHMVNTPFYDQWEIAPILRNILNGHFYFHDFWQQHNEHRIFLPRILMVSMAILTNWDVRYELVISLCLAFISFGVLLYTLYRVVIAQKIDQAGKWFAPMVVCLPLLLSMIWFSLLQQENWMWGWQIQWFLNVLGVVLALYGLKRLVEKVEASSLALMVTGGLIAQFSLGSGVLIWPVLLLGLILIKMPRNVIIPVAVTGLLATLLYYVGYHNPADDHSKTLVLHQPLAYLHYLAIYFGRPLSSSAWLAPTLGIATSVVFVAFAGYLLLRQSVRFRVQLPFILLGVYSLCSGVITGLSRLGFGLNQAFTSRYTTLSSLLLVSLLVLLVLNADIIASWLRRAFVPLAAAALIIVSALVIQNMQLGRQQADKQAQYLKDIYSCTHQVDPYSVCLLSTYPNEVIARERINYLKSIHWGGY